MAAVPPPIPMRGADMQALLRAQGADNAHVSGFHYKENTVTFDVTIGAKAWKFVVGEEAIFAAIQSGGGTNVTKEWAKGIATYIMELNKLQSGDVQSARYVHGTQTLTINGEEISLSKSDVSKGKWDALIQSRDKTQTHIGLLQVQLRNLTTTRDGLHRQLEAIEPQERSGLLRRKNFTTDQLENRADIGKQIQEHQKEIAALGDQIKKAGEAVQKLESQLIPYHIANEFAKAVLGLPFAYSGAGGTALSRTTVATGAPVDLLDSITLPGGTTIQSQVLTIHPEVTATEPAPGRAFDAQAFKTQIFIKYSDEEQAIYCHQKIEAEEAKPAGQQNTEWLTALREVLNEAEKDIQANAAAASSSAPSPAVAPDAYYIANAGPYTDHVTEFEPIRTNFTANGFNSFLTENYPDVQERRNFLLDKLQLEQRKADGERNNLLVENLIKEMTESFKPNVVLHANFKVFDVYSKQALTEYLENVAEGEARNKFTRSFFLHEIQKPPIEQNIRLIQDLHEILKNHP